MRAVVPAAFTRAPRDYHDRQTNVDVAAQVVSHPA
jgi:hypothetical protein